jgi:hypothetical protein
MPHRRRRHFRIAAGDLFENFMMFLIGTFHFTSFHQAKTPEEIKFVEEARINAQQPSVATPFHQLSVKPEVESIVPIEIFSFRRVIQRFHERFQFFLSASGMTGRECPPRKSNESSLRCVRVGTPCLCCVAGCKDCLVAPFNWSSRVRLVGAPR